MAGISRFRPALAALTPNPDFYSLNAHLAPEKPKTGMTARRADVP